MTTPFPSGTVRHSFFDLGFRASDEVSIDGPERAQVEPTQTKSSSPPLRLGRKKSSLKWELAAWVALAAGIFARQGLDLPVLMWRISNVRVGAAVASLVVALAVFPMMMRWLNRRRRRASLEHVAAPFAFGFFLDLAV